MAGKREKKRNHRGLKLLGSCVLLGAAALMLAPLTGSADAGNMSPSPIEEAEIIVPWGEPLPSVSALDVYLPEEPLPPADTTTVPLSAPVEDSYFADAAFLGDSRTEGFHLYSGLKEGQYYYAVGATVETVFSKPVWKTPNGKVALLDAMQPTSPAKIYVMLGVNELGWPRSESFRQYYTRVVERLRADHPESVIVLQSILPVSASQEAKHSYVNNRRIGEFNTIIQEVAEAQQCRFLNVAEAVTDEFGNLPEDWSFDGVHLNRTGCAVWLDYLKTHSV